MSTICGALVAGCGTTYTASVLDEIDEKAPSTGVRYYLPQDVLQVTVQLQTRTPIKIRKCDTATEAGCTTSVWRIYKEPAVTEPVDVSVDLMTVSDTNFALLVDTNGVAFGKSDSTITVSEHGLLQSVNAKTQGTAGTVVQNLMKLAATAASLSSFSIGAVPLPPVGSVAPTHGDLRASRDANTSIFGAGAGFSVMKASLQASPTNEGAPAAAEVEPPPAPPADSVAKTFDDKSYLPAAKALRSNAFTISDLTLNSLREQTTIFDPATVNLSIGQKPNEKREDELRRCASSDVTDDDTFMARYVSAAEALRLGFQELESEVRKRHRLNVCNSLRALDDSSARLVNAQQELADANSREKIYVATRKIPALRSEYNAFLTSALGASSDLKAAAEAKAREAGFGAEPKKSTKKYEIPLRYFKHASRYESIVDADFEKFRDKLELSQRDNKYMFNEAALVFSVDDVQQPPAIPGGKEHLYSSSPKVCGEGTIKEGAKPCIYHRIARPVRLTAWTIGKKKLDGADVHFLNPISSRVVDVVDEYSVVQAIDLHSSSWTKRDFAVEFTPQGRLVSVKRDYGSAAEDASGALQLGLSGALGAYQSGLSSVKSIRETENALELLPLQQQLALGQAQGGLQLLPLQQQLALAQAQGSLASHPLQQQLLMANAQSALTIQPINAQLAEAQAQLNLIKAQAGLQAGQEGFSAIVQAQLADLERTLVVAQQQLIASQASLGAQQFGSESTVMQAEIARIRNEIDLIKLRRDLEELKSN